MQTIQNQLSGRTRRNHKIYRGHKDMNCIFGQFIEKVVFMSINGNWEPDLIQNHTKSAGVPVEAPPWIKLWLLHPVNIVLLCFFITIFFVGWNVWCVNRGKGRYLLNIFKLGPNILIFLFFTLIHDYSFLLLSSVLLFFSIISFDDSPLLSITLASIFYYHLAWMAITIVLSLK